MTAGPLRAAADRLLTAALRPTQRNERPAAPHTAVSLRTWSRAHQLAWQQALQEACAATPQALRHAALN